MSFINIGDVVLISTPELTQKFIISDIVPSKNQILLRYIDDPIYISGITKKIIFGKLSGNNFKLF